MINNAKAGTIMRRLYCNILEQDHGFILKSPLIGQISLFLEVNQCVNKEEAIGILNRNGEKFLLLNAQEVGIIKQTKNEQQKFDVEFNETFLWVDYQHDIKQKSTKTTKAQDTGSKNYIHAPMDGLIYLRPDPKAKAFVNIGDTIEHGCVLGLIEVMKNFYPIKYDQNKKAVIKDVLVQDTSPITNGQPLFKVDFL